MIAGFMIMLALGHTQASADAMIESVIKNKIMSAMSIQKNKSYFHGHSMRSEEMDGSLIYLYLPDEGRIVNIKAASASFLEEPIHLKTTGTDSETGIIRKQDNKITHEEFNVKATGKTRTILGYPCREHVLTWYVETKDVHTHKKNKARLTMHLWVAKFDTRLKELENSEMGYTKAFAKAVGMKATLDQALQALSPMKIFANVSSDKMVQAYQKMKGYVLAHSLKFEVQNLDMGYMMTDKEQLEMQKTRREMKAMQAQVANLPPQMRAMLGMMTGTATQMSTLINLEREITRFDTASLPASLFAVPKDYKLTHAQWHPTDDGSGIDTMDSTSRLPAKKCTTDKAAWVAFYNQWKGVPYEWGGNGPDKGDKGFDCSGLVKRGYQDVLGKTLPRKSTEQAKQGRRISISQAKTGDLIFFEPHNGVSHIGIYFAKGKFMHASSSKGVICSSVNNQYWANRKPIYYHVP